VLVFGVRGWVCGPGQRSGGVGEAGELVTGRADMLGKVCEAG